MKTTDKSVIQKFVKENTNAYSWQDDIRQLKPLQKVFNKNQAVDGREKYLVVSEPTEKNKYPIAIRVLKIAENTYIPFDKLTSNTETTSSAMGLDLSNADLLDQSIVMETLPHYVDGIDSPYVSSKKDYNLKSDFRGNIRDSYKPKYSSVNGSNTNNELTPEQYKDELYKASGSKDSKETWWQKNGWNTIANIGNIATSFIAGVQQGKSTKTTSEVTTKDIDNKEDDKKTSPLMVVGITVGVLALLYIGYKFINKQVAVKAA